MNLNEQVTYYWFVSLNNNKKMWIVILFWKYVQMYILWWITFLVLLFFRKVNIPCQACTTPAFSRDIFETHEQFWQSSDSRVQTQTVWRNRLAALSSSALYYKAFTLIHHYTLLHFSNNFSSEWKRTERRW